MKQATQTQPNFELIKIAFYQAYIGSEKINLSILMQSICGQILPSFNKRKDELKKDFNQWLDRVDIRQAGELILILKEDKKTVPKWASNWQYNIDYNDYGMLDLIRIDN